MEDDLARRAEEARGRVEPFVRRHFGLLGSLRLHRSALGWDVLRAPANVVLAPFDLIRRLLAALLRRVGLRRAGGRLAARPLGLATTVTRRVEALVTEEILRPMAAGDPAREARLDRWAPGALAEYGAARTAASELTVLACVLIVGATAFGMLSLGTISLAPEVAQRLAQDAALAEFPLGKGFGRLWYGAMPVEAGASRVVAVGLGLALAASLLATFAGVVADPLQSRAGLHRARLVRLVRSLEAELADAPRPYASRSPYLARVADIADVGAAILRFLRP